jgi:hypothetical protein
MRTAVEMLERTSPRDVDALFRAPHLAQTRMDEPDAGLSSSNERADILSQN